MGFVDDPEPCGWLHRPIGLHRRITTQRSVFVNDNFSFAHQTLDDRLGGLDLGCDTVDHNSGYGDGFGGLDVLHYVDTITDNEYVVNDQMAKRLANQTRKTKKYLDIVKEVCTSHNVSRTFFNNLSH